MFKFGMDIPKGATQLVLPDNKDIVLFAATVVKEENPQVTPASRLFRTALKPQQGDKANAPKANLMKGAKVIACSGFVNEEESPERMIDGVILPAYLIMQTSIRVKHRISAVGSW